MHLQSEPKCRISESAVAAEGWWYYFEETTWCERTKGKSQHLPRT